MSKKNKQLQVKNVTKLHVYYEAFTIVMVRTIPHCLQKNEE